MTKQIRVSLNKIAEFTYASAGRRETIVREQKHKKPFIAAGYRKAEEFLPQYFGSQMDADILQQRITQLVGLHSLTPKDEYNNAINALSALNQVKSFAPPNNVEYVALPMNASDGLIIEDVFINIRPDCFVVDEFKGAARVGALKLHFPKTNSLGEKVGKCVAAILFEYLTQLKTLPGVPKYSLCYSLDIPADQTYRAPESYKSILKELNAACRQYIWFWENIP